MIDFNLKKKIGNKIYKYKIKSNSKIIAVMGPSGAGKTSLLRLLSGLITPDDGHIRINDVLIYDHNSINVKTKKRNIAYIFQHDNIFPHLNVEENICLGMEGSQSENVLLWLDKFGLGDIRKSKTFNLSGGEKQRIALIRSLLHNPQLLLLDEAFSSLDEENKNLLYGEIRSILQNYKGHTILVTHDYKEAVKLADEIFYLSNESLKRIPSNILEGTIVDIEKSNRGDIFTIDSENLLLKGIVLKDFIKLGDVIKIEIDSNNVILKRKTTNEIELVDYNIIPGKVINLFDDSFELSVDGKILYSRNLTERFNIFDDIDLYIKYKDVNIVK